MQQVKGSLASFVVAMLVCLATAAVCGGADLDLVPWPKSVETGSGSLELTAKTRIVATEASLLPLAKLLAEEIAKTAGG
jgi:hypothetical protein